ncbi:hypothetical protein [Pseudonocardia phyllosphaerae]|uniref:hypothetical protein n=1 Tax=Pseudonocardia phyllosphaerae TaxID=3390502 RepID=UPI00397E6DE9
MTTLWVLHALLRFVLIVWLSNYAFAKLYLGQMQQLDYSWALTTVGEKSPMGLLWLFMGYSPVVQFLAGLAELVVMLLLVFRRTAWLGGLIGVVALGTVFLLNLTFDVPVKQPALAGTIALFLVALPELPRVLQFVTGRPAAGTAGSPPLLPWPRIRRVTRWADPVLGLVLVVFLGWSQWQWQSPSARIDSALPGVYRVVSDRSTVPGGERWTEVALGQWTPTAAIELPGINWENGSAGVRTRTADGQLLKGRYHLVRGDGVAMTLKPDVVPDDPAAGRPPQDLELRWSARPDGTVTLTGAGRDLVLVRDPNRTLLYDRGFSWNLGDDAAVNR